MTTSTTTQAQTPVVTEVTRATWKQHGQPTAKFTFYGTEVKAAAAKGQKIAKVETDGSHITLIGHGGRMIEGGKFGPATKFWAAVPADAPRRETAERTHREKTEAAPIVITAAKGGTQTVAPKKGAIAKAITASGKSIMAISRDHGLNPSQMRRLAADTVAKVDLPRAEAIAKALGVELGKLFDAPQDKAAAKAPKTPAAQGTGTGATGKGRQSRTAKAAAKTQAEEAARTEAEAAQDSAEGTQDPEGPAPEAEGTQAPEGTDPQA